MLYISRLIIAVIYSISTCVFGSIYCLLSPCSPKHMVTSGRMFGRPAPPFGLRVGCRRPADAESYGNAIYITSHQNNYDIVTASNIVQPSTVTVGEKSLLWISFLGQLHWLIGNLLIDRNNRTKAHDTTTETVNHFKKCHISIWMFPEGVHSHGHGLLPFKAGTFHTVIAAGVLAIPVYVSTTSDKTNPNRLHSDPVIAEMLPPIDISQYGRDQACGSAARCRSIMEQKIAELDKEVAEHEAARKV